MIDLTGAEWAVLVPGLLVVIAVSIRLAMIDWREHLLPDRLTRPLTAFVAAWVLVLGIVHGEIERGVTAIGWGVGAFALFFVLSFAGMGGGDIKFAPPLGATLGWFGASSVWAGVTGLIVSGGLVGLIVLVQGKGSEHRVAYGPYMAFGLICGIVRGLIG